MCWFEALICVGLNVETRWMQNQQESVYQWISEHIRSSFEVTEEWLHYQPVIQKVLQMWENNKNKKLNKKITKKKEISLILELSPRKYFFFDEQLNLYPCFFDHQIFLPQMSSITTKYLIFYVLDIYFW